MRKSRMPATIRLAAAVSCTLAAACSGGGGASPATSGAALSTTASTTPIAIYSTGASGTVAAPAAAAFGTAPAQTATANGPTFDGKNGGYPANVTFPLISSSLQKAPSGLTAVAADQGATATVVSTSFNSSTLQLVVPSLNLNTQIKLNSSLVSGMDQITDGYSYVVTGAYWNNTGQTSATMQSATAFTFGYETPAAGMPTSGTATFTGVAGASVFKPSGTDIQYTNVVGGAASLSANFGSGQMSGSFTKMITLDNKAWNDVSVTASIAAGTNRFNGTTAAAATSDVTGMRLSASATGFINGAFFGPAAQNLGAVWSLSNGSESVLGTVTAK